MTLGEKVKVTHEDGQTEIYKDILLLENQG